MRVKCKIYAALNSKLTHVNNVPYRCITRLVDQPDAGYTTGCPVDQTANNPLRYAILVKQCEMTVSRGRTRLLK